MGNPSMGQSPQSPPPEGLDEQDRVAWARGQFEAARGYLNSASLGLPTRATLAALAAAHEEWRLGYAEPVAYDAPVERSRQLYADFVGVGVAQVATGSQVSTFVGMVAASLPTGSEVLTVADDFTSVTFPFHAQPGGRLRVREVPLERLVESVDASTDLVSVSAVQSRNGRIADLDALAEVCAAHGADILLDITQAAGWLPVDASRFTYTVCGGYKWLLAARGTAFFTIRPDAMADIVPHSAGWYAGTDPWQSIYGSPLRLAESAKRFDLSPAWLSWVSQQPALELLSYVGPSALYSNAIGLADRFCRGVDLAPQGSAIVSMAIDDQAAERLEAAGVRAAMRAGRLRLSFHISTSADDVDLAVDALAGHVT